MSKKWNEILLALLIGLVIPTMLFALFMRRDSTEGPSDITSETTDPRERESRSLLIPVLMDDGSVSDIEMDAYLTAVLLCEMPVEFDIEALKAQAVVARTYALRGHETMGKHESAAVCSDAACCQGYRSVEVFIGDGGSQAMVDKVVNAVQATSGQVLTYDGELIEATYFSCSGGMTEDAVAVWGSDIPYLQATESPGEENASHYVDTVTFSMSEFKRLLGIGDTVANTTIENITYTNGGGVNTIRIFGSDFSGKEVRSKLGLRSTAFVMTVIGDSITVTTKGYGHRVGMSQYGAEAMAVRGYDYKEILSHYYRGTEVNNYQDS